MPLTPTSNGIGEAILRFIRPPAVSNQKKAARTERLSLCRMYGLLEVQPLDLVSGCVGFNKLVVVELVVLGVVDYDTVGISVLV